MLKDKIGQNAGMLWLLIDDNKELDLKELALLSKLNEADFYMAVGWLARENKIAMYEKNKALMFFLI